MFTRLLPNYTVLAQSSALVLTLLACPPAFCQDQIRIVGSSTVYPFATVVAERLGRKSGLKTPVIESTGTGGGMKLFCSGVGKNSADITNASRAMKKSEWDLCQKNGVTDIVEIVIGNDGIAFANSAKGKKFNFTKGQLWKAMAAKGPKPKLWSEVDPKLPATKIEILTPPPTSGTRDAWNSLVMAKGCDPAVKEKNDKDCELMREDGPVVEAGENDALIVQKLDANSEAFGIFGFSYLDSNLDKLQAADIDGVAISLDSIQSYEYPVARPLYFYIKKAHLGKVAGLEEYTTEFTSKNAIGEDGYLLDVGLVPLDSAKLQAVRKTAEGMVAMEAKTS